MAIDSEEAETEEEKAVEDGGGDYEVIGIPPPRMPPLNRRAAPRCPARAPVDEAEEDEPAEAVQPRTGQRSRPEAASSRGGAAAKREQRKALTGIVADWPTLGLDRSLDVPMNIALVLHGRLVTHKWKSFVWMARMKEARMKEGLPFKRSPRWLSMLLADELASIWGHVGSAVRELRNHNKGPPLFR